MQRRTWIVLGCLLGSVPAWANHTSGRTECQALELAVARAYGSLDILDNYVAPEIPDGTSPEDAAIILADWQATRAAAILAAEQALATCIHAP